MPSESIASFDSGDMPGDRAWIFRCYEWGIAYVTFIVGDPPPGSSIGIIWNEHDLGEYPSIGISWDYDRPDDYISKCERVLERFDQGVDWHSISPDATYDLVSDETDTDNENDPDSELD